MSAPASPSSRSGRFWMGASILQDGAPLFRTEGGVVLHCACCARVQVAFDGVALLISTGDFRSLCAVVASATREVRAGGRRSAWWRLQAATAAGEVSEVLRGSELLRLHELLHGAAAMLELKIMLADALRT